jgi:integrase
MGAFMAKLRERDGTAALALEFTILTAARTSEILGATWAEFDLERAVWTIPAARMKAGREHRVPLSTAALDVLRRAKGLGGDWVFKGQRGGQLSGMSMAMLLRRMGLEVTVHGFRSAFRDWAAETTAYPHDVCEAALAHTVGSKVVAAYLRGDLFEKRRRLMADWAAHCERGESSIDGAVPLRQRSA